MTAGILLDMVKTLPPPDTLLLSSNKYLATIISSWPDVQPIFDRKAKIDLPDYSKWVETIWQYCDINQEKLGIVTGMSPYKALKGLKTAAYKRYVFPDGTIHEEVKKILPAIQFCALKGMK